MARINAMELDEVVQRVRASGQNADKALKKAVSAAGDIFVSEITAQIDAQDVWDSGALWWSIKKGSAVKSGDGYTLEAWPQGKRYDDNHPKGERNETIGFVNEYGRKKKAPYAGRPYLERATLASEEKVIEAILDILERDLLG